MFKLVNEFVDRLKKAITKKQELQIISCDERGLECDTRSRAIRVFSQVEQQRDRHRGGL